MTYLDLSYDGISSLPIGLPGALPNIGNGGLGLDGNKLCPLSMESTVLDFANFANVRWQYWRYSQDMRSCPAFELNSGNIGQAPFNCTPNSDYCDLSYYGITSIAPDTFSGLVGVYEVDLYNNQLTTIGANTFNGLDDLNYLDLSTNNIISLASNAFN